MQSDATHSIWVCGMQWTETWTLSVLLNTASGPSHIAQMGCEHHAICNMQNFTPLCVHHHGFTQKFMQNGIYAQLPHAL